MQPTYICTVIALTPFIYTYLSLSGSMETLSNTSKSTPANVRDSRAADRGGSLAIDLSVRTPIFFRLRFLKSYIEMYMHTYMCTYIRTQDTPCRESRVTDHPHFPCHSWAVSDVRASHFEGILRLCRCLLGIPPPDQLWEGLTSAENGGRGVVHRALAAEKAQRDAPDGLASEHGKEPPYNCCLYARKHLLNTSQRSHGSAHSFATGRGHFE